MLKTDLKGRSGLFVAGLISLAVYLTLAMRLPWWRYGGRLSSWSQILGRDSGTLAACLAGIGLLLAAYLWGWRAVRAGEAPRWMIWAGAVVYALTLFWLLPITADLFLYLVRAHLFTDLGANPLQVAPFALPNDSLLAAYAIGYESQPTVYGPAWILLSALGALGKNDVIMGLFYLKGLAVVAYLGCVWLVERILRRVRPESALEGFYLFAWNPLVLLMAVGDGHNDIVMMALVLLAGWWLLCERWTLAFAALALSVWTKYVSVLFFPLFLLYVWWQLAPQSRRRLAVLGQGSVVMAGVSALVIGPFWYPELLPSLVQRLAHPLSLEMPGLSQRALGAGLGLFVVGYAAAFGWIVRGPRSLPKLLDASFVVTLLVILFGAARSQPWHLIWPTALAGLSAKRWVWLVVIAAAAVMLVEQVWIEWGAPGLDILF
jgi:hypothetical protein